MTELFRSIAYLHFLVRLTVAKKADLLKLHKTGVITAQTHNFTI